MPPPPISVPVLLYALCFDDEKSWTLMYDSFFFHTSFLFFDVRFGYGRFRFCSITDFDVKSFSFYLFSLESPRSLSLFRSISLYLHECNSQLLFWGHVEISGMRQTLLKRRHSFSTLLKLSYLKNVSISILISDATAGFCSLCFASISCYIAIHRRSL